MNKKIVTSLFCLLISASGVFAQQKQEGKKPMKMEVREENGETTVIVTSEENGQPISRIYHGEEAKKKLAEIQGETQEEGKQVEVELTEENGQKKLRVITRENGEEKVEEFVGEAADAKLKELESAEKKEKTAEDFKLTPKQNNHREKSVD